MKLHRNYSLVLLLVCNRSGVLSHALRWEKPMPWLILKRQVGSALGSRSTGALLPSPEQPGWQCVTFLCIHTHREIAAPRKESGALCLIRVHQLCSFRLKTASFQLPTHARKSLRVRGRGWWKIRNLCPPIFMGQHKIKMKIETQIASSNKST